MRTWRYVVGHCGHLLPGCHGPQCYSVRRWIGKVVKRLVEPYVKGLLDFLGPVIYIGCFWTWTCTPGIVLSACCLQSSAFGHPGGVHKHDSRRCEVSTDPGLYQSEFRMGSVGRHLNHRCADGAGNCKVAQSGCMHMARDWGQTCAGQERPEGI
jgi:hypothetical protein